MNAQPKTLKELQINLKTLRGNPKFRNKFPKQIWNSIIELTKDVPFQEVCQKLDIQPTYLKRKMHQLQNTPLDTIDFQEISCGTQVVHFADAVVIELISGSGLKAKIQGSSICLGFLSSLFGCK